MSRLALAHDGSMDRSAGRAGALERNILWTLSHFSYKVCAMGRSTRPVFPRAQAKLTALGERLRDARLRRRVSQEAMAARVGIARGTLRRLEQGDPAVNLSTLVRVLAVLGLDADLERIVGDDAIGRRLQDLELTQRPHPRKRGAV